MGTMSTFGQVEKPARLWFMLGKVLKRQGKISSGKCGEFGRDGLGCAKHRPDGRPDAIVAAGAGVHPGRSDVSNLDEFRELKFCGRVPCFAAYSLSWRKRKTVATGTDAALTYIQACPRLVSR